MSSSLLHTAQSDAAQSISLSRSLLSEWSRSWDVEVGAVSISNDLPLTGLEAPAMAKSYLLHPPPLDFLPQVCHTVPGLSSHGLQCRQPALRNSYRRWGQSGSEIRLSNVSRGSAEVWGSWGCLRGATSPWLCSVTSHTTQSPGNSVLFWKDQKWIESRAAIRVGVTVGHRLK